MAFVDYEPYLWRETDNFAKKWLPQNGYRIIKAEQFKDFVAYRVQRRKVEFTVFVFAFGKARKFPEFNADICMSLGDISFAAGSTVLILYLYVEEVRSEDGKITYDVHSCYGKGKHIEFWQPVHRLERNMLLYYPRKEMVEMSERFCVAFNTQNQDIFDTIFSEDIHWEHLNSSTSYRAGVYSYMKKLFTENGKLQIAYGRVNDAIYCDAPYLEGLGIVGFSVNKQDRIDKIQEYENSYFQEIIKSKIYPEESEMDLPHIIESIEFFSPAMTQKYAVKLKFDTGEVKKYRFAMSNDSFEDEVSPFRNHTFTQKIFDKGFLENNRLCFYNGFSISSNELYHDSIPFCETETKGEIVFQNNQYKVEYVFSAQDISLRYNTGADLFEAMLPDENGMVHQWDKVYFEHLNCAKTYLNTDGTRATSLEFVRTGDFQEGLAYVLVYGYQYAYVDKDLQFAIPPEYYDAHGFKESLACVVERWGDTLKMFFIDHAGKKIWPEKWNSIKAATDFQGGLARVSLEKVRPDYQVWNIGNYHYAGNWGFIDKRGKEIIEPQYLFATDFEDARAIVCKKEAKVGTDADDNTPHDYNERWGVIDKIGQEVIPCIYDEVSVLRDSHKDDMVAGFAVHEGGWPTGRWGAFDTDGNRIAPSIFEKLGYEYSCGYLIFYKTNKHIKFVDDAPMGVFDIKKQKVIIKPIYEDVDILGENRFRVEYHDKKSQKTLEKVIDGKNKTIIGGNYSLLIEHSDKMIAKIIEDDGRHRYIVIDSGGNCLVDLGYEPAWWYASNPFGKNFIFEKDGKAGAKDYEGNVIIEPHYNYISRIYDADLFLVSNATEKTGIIDMQENVLVPLAYDDIRFSDGYALARNGIQTDVYRICEQHEFRNE